MSNIAKFARSDDPNTVTDPFTTNEDESDDLFSDDEQEKEMKCRSDVSQDILALHRSETPLSSIDDSNVAMMSSDPIIPSTPLSLMPFLNKINDQWSSDLETPQGNKSVEPHAKLSTSSTKSIEITPKLEHTPDISTDKSADNKITSDSPVIVSKRLRKRSKRRCIFKSSMSVNTLAVTNNEHITVNAQTEAPLAPENTNLESRDNTTYVAISTLHVDRLTCEEHEPQVLNRIQDTCNNEELGESRNIMPDKLNLSTQEFFSNVSFSTIDKLCSNNPDKQATIETITKCNYKENTENVDKERNISPIFNLDKIEENINTGFFTARGTAIKVSKEALLKSKALLADEMQIKSNELLNKKNPIEQNNKNLPAISIANSISVNTAEEVLPEPKSHFTELLKNCDKMQIENSEKSFVDKSSIKEINVPCFPFSTVSGAPINISREVLSETKTDESSKNNDNDNNVLMKYENSSLKKNFKQDHIGLSSLSTTGFAPINTSKRKALVKTKALFAEQLNAPVESVTSNKIDISANDESETKTINIGFKTARGTPINISEQALAKAKALFAEELDKPLESNVVEEANIHNKRDKGQEEKKIVDTGFRTARGAAINISKQALSKAKILFEKQLDYPSETNVLEDITEEYGGFQPTSSEHQGAVSNNVILRPQALFPNNWLDKSSSDVTSLQKRKLNLDDGASPLGGSSVSELKKARLSDEIQTRKLFSDIADNDKIKSEDIYITTNRMIIDDDTDDRRYNRGLEASCASGSNSMSPVAELSNEMAASDVEFDPDERRQISSVAVSTLESPRREISDSTESNAVGSPVIGRQPTSKKRKSLGKRTGDKHANTSRTDQTINPFDTNVMASRESSTLRENTLCERIGENELNAESQKFTQPERQKAESNSAESAEYGDTQTMMVFIDESARILHDRWAAALEQEQTITARRTRRSKQVTGHLYRYKQINSNARSSLRDLGNGSPPVPRSYRELIEQRIPPNILAITAATAASYKFRCSDFYGNDVARTNVHGIEMEDGARLIMDENGYVGVWEFLRAFLASPGVDPNLVPARWIENHYRWIVWKLASMDRMKFGTAELPRALTPSRVIAQLKYRYDREIDRSQRPAIRRILEKDEVASKRMILCVSSIVENSNMTMEIGKSPRIGVPKWKIELTDGWYSIPACMDIGMVRNISTGRVKEGTKLLIFGAELLNCDEGCYPLEAPTDVCLKLHTNSTRRARWDSKLGYTPRPGPIPIRLHNVCPSGGLIGKMTIIIARIYPMLFHERTASGESIIRNTKCEEKAQIEYEQQCRSKVEAFYAKAENDFQEDLSCETGSMDLFASQFSKDHGSSSMEFVSKKQHDELLQELRVKEDKFKQKLQSKLRESLPAPRQVSSLLKVRVCDGNTNAILSIWSPSEEIVDALKEGACVSLCNVIASGKRGCELQLTARRSTIFNPGTMHDTSYPYRMCTSFCEMSSFEFTPPYGEFDTVGFICSVGPAPYSMKDFEVVHLAYPKTDSSSSLYLSILFWQGIASYGYAEILTVGSIVACNNLEWRRATSWNLPVTYCTDRSIFTRNIRRRNHLYESFESLQNLITAPVAYAEKCASELNIELQKKPTARYTPNKNTPNKINNNPASISDKKLIDYTPPLSKLGIANSRNFTTTNPSIQKRLDKLLYYGESSEMSPIIIKSSKRVSLDFRSPVRTAEVHPTRDTSSTDKPGHSNLSIAPEEQ